MLWKPEVGLSLQGHSSDNEIAPWIRPLHNPNNFSRCNENHSRQIVPNCYLCHFFFLAEWINEEKSFRWDILVLRPLKETKGNRGKVTQLLAGENQVFLYSWWIDSFSGLSDLKHQFPFQPDGFEPNTTTYWQTRPASVGTGLWALLWSHYFVQTPETIHWAEHKGRLMELYSYTQQVGNPVSRYLLRSTERMYLCLKLPGQLSALPEKMGMRFVWRGPEGNLDGTVWMHSAQGMEAMQSLCRTWF